MLFIYLVYFTFFFQALCIAVAIAVNYLYLIAFGWMIMEGVLLYLKVVKVFNISTNIKYFYGFTWGNKHIS